jgi:Leucine-rich repeat (LRR) protein
MSTIDLQYNQLKNMIDLDEKPYDILLLNKNSLRYVPFDKIPPSIKHISLDENRLSRLEIDLPMRNLQTLSAQKNDISYIDFTVELTALHTLNVRNNHLHTLEFLEATPNLKNLNLSLNDVLTLQHLPSTLETLDASLCNISMISSRMPRSLLDLNLAMNYLRNGSLPFFWGTNLRSLNLSNNLLTKFPKRLPDSIEFLHLQNNKLVEIPEKLPSNLKVLNISLNHLSKLPSKTNVRLDLLVIRGNHLTQDFTEEPVSWSRHTIEDTNWNMDTHHKAQTRIKRCWKRCLLKIRCRHIYRTRKIYEELLMISLHPDRILQTDALSPEWFRKSLQ